MTRNYACQAFAVADDIFDAPCGCDLDSTAAEDIIFVEAMIDQASDMLSLATGGTVSGICTVTVRPVALCNTNTVYYGRYEPIIPTFPTHDHRRRFGGLNTVPLRGPNTDVVEVVINGVVINPAEYGLLDNLYLMRKIGNWPTYQDLTLDDTEAGTWAITYRFGRGADKLTKMACIELACELIKDATPGKQSSLPRGVVGASIQGASITIRDRAEALRDGAEQIPIVARFLSVYAYEGPGFHSGVWSPELDQDWNLVEVEGPSGS